MLEMLREFLLENYQPAIDMQDATVRMTTREIYNKLYSHYPSEELTPMIVAEWLAAGGFKFIDVGEFTFEWIMKEKS